MKRFPKLLIAICSVIFFGNGAGAQPASALHRIEWQITKNFSDDSANVPYLFSFLGAVYAENSHIPLLKGSQTLPFGHTVQSVGIGSLEFEEVHMPHIFGLGGIDGPAPQLETDDIYYISREATVEYSLVPFRRSPATGAVERLVRYSLDIVSTPPPPVRAQGGQRSSSSAMAAGNWHKIGVAHSGLVRIDRAALQKAGINPDATAPADLRVYGRKGGMLPLGNSQEVDTDPRELAVFVSGQGASFGASDYLLFYAEGPTAWEYDNASGQFRHRPNPWCDTAYYYIVTGLGPGKRMPTVDKGTGTADVVIGTYPIYNVHNVDKWTEINKAVKSGVMWYGEEFRSHNMVPIAHSFSLGMGQRDPSELVNIRIRAAARSGTASHFTAKAGSNTLGHMQVAAAFVSDYLQPFVVARETTFTATGIGSSHVGVTLEYNKSTQTSVGWLDFIEMNSNAVLRYNGAPLAFDVRVQPGQTGKVTIDGAVPGMSIWCVGQHHNAFAVQYAMEGGKAVFYTTDTEWTKYVAFVGGGQSPVAFGRVANQDLKSLAPADMFIVSHPHFLATAQKVADYHRQTDGFKIHIVTPRQIFDEFACGTQDPAAIRNFLRYFYKNAQAPDQLPRYLMVIGDASYDVKDRIPGNTNYVVGFQSNNTEDPVNSFISDDFYGCLDDNEGQWWDSGPRADRIDLGIGRWPVNNMQQAENMYQKMMRYVSPNALGRWRNTVCIVADDGDYNAHFTQSEVACRIVEQQSPNFNVRKIYLDAYEQKSTPNGFRYPDATADLNRQMKEGALAVMYIGHGSTQGLAHEHLVRLHDISSWHNMHNMPLVITGTCEFGRYDDPERTSGGELLFLKPDGGAIAMLTTTRVVYIHENGQLSPQLFDNNLLATDNGQGQRLGDIVRITKEKLRNNGNFNMANFTLLGDPALRLAIPRYEAEVTHLNGSDMSGDTVLFRALDEASISGHIAYGPGGNRVENFNGDIIVTVFDKPVTRETRANASDSRKASYTVNGNIIFNGQAKVVNGQWSVKFVVPRDINFSIGDGKISMYAMDISQNIDAAGHNNRFRVGSMNTHVVDNEPPTVQVFINDTNFIRGGLTHQNPLLLAQVADNLGINTAGVGFGHELSARLSDGSYYVLNDHFITGEDSRRGTIQYPLYNLPDGHYLVEVKVWDVNNNSATGNTEFVVVNSKDFKVDKIFAYPNPFTDRTWFSIEHNRPGETIRYRLQICDLSGRIVKAFGGAMTSEGSRNTQLSWDGTDDGGSKLAAGMYVCTITAETADGKQARLNQKLLLVR